MTVRASTASLITEGEIKLPSNCQIAASVARVVVLLAAKMAGQRGHVNLRVKSNGNVSETVGMLKTACVDLSRRIEQCFE